MKQHGKGTTPLAELPVKLLRKKMTTQRMKLYSVSNEVPVRSFRYVGGFGKDVQALVLSKRKGALNPIDSTAMFDPF